MISPSTQSLVVCTASLDLHPDIALVVGESSILVDDVLLHVLPSGVHGVLRVLKVLRAALGEYHHFPSWPSLML